MYRYSNGQISLSDFKQPVGMNLKESNRWVKQAQTIPWLDIEKRYAKLLPIAREMLRSLCVWLWEPASPRRNTGIPMKKPRCRFRRIRISSISAAIPATMTSIFRSMLLSWCTFANV